ncbi:MAG: enolase [Clostridiales bacterium]|jgi:hypothetical protein|nr:enolase [Clostridiales bacterium]
MDMLGFASVSSITVICYLAALIIKATPVDNKWIPAVCGVLGGIIGGFAYHIIPSFPSEDPLSSIAVGIVSGLAATGVHQACKKLKK